MRFRFDPTKAAANWRKHGVSLAEAEAVFHDALALQRADPDSEGESRMVAIGEGSAGVLLVVVYAERGSERN
jgi:uncharacterized DUF497 family protein